MYVVQYGITRDGLNQKSSSVYSGDDIIITNKTYSVELSGLIDNTTYHVQVLAINTAQDHCYKVYNTISDGDESR